MNDLIRVRDNTVLLDAEASLKIAEFERQMKAIKKAEDDLKERILAEMESKNILKVETDDVTISYIAPTDRETFDSKRFKFDHPETYDDYVKMSPVKASVRIKVKDND